MRQLWLIAPLTLLLSGAGCSAAATQREEVVSAEAEAPAEAVVLDEEGQRDRALAEAEAFFSVWSTRDIEAMVARTHPVVVAGIGGPERAYAAIEKVILGMDEVGMVSKLEAVEKPARVLPSAGKHYTIVPYRLLMITEGKGTLRAVSYLVGESRDGGQRWFFIDGKGVQQDRARLLEFLPDFPAELELPEASLAPVE